MASEDIQVLEVELPEGVRQINECEYLLAVGVCEIEELTLELTLEEAKLQSPILVAQGESPVEQLRVGGRPIETDATCRIFRFLFERRYMVSYSVLNESYGVYPEPPEQFSGKLFRAFTWSHLLEFTKKTTCASDEYPGVLQHYQIACLNHVIDVICTGPPRISVRMPMAVKQPKPS